MKTGIEPNQKVGLLLEVVLEECAAARIEELSDAERVALYVDELTIMFKRVLNERIETILDVDGGHGVVVHRLNPNKEV